MPLLYSPRLHLTNMRAVLSGESHSEGRPPETWGLSIRHEWISEVGVVRRLAPPKKGLFREKPRSFTDFVYLRCGLPTKVIFELRFEPAEGHSSESVAEEILDRVAQMPGRERQPKTTSKREHQINRFASYIDEHAGSSLSGAVPVSLPPAL